MRLAKMIAPALDVADNADMIERLAAGMPGLTQRASTLPELADAARFYVQRPRFPLENPKAAKLVSGDGPAIAKDFADQVLSTLSPWTTESLHDAMQAYCDAKGLGFGKVAQPIRGAVTGSNASPDLMEVLFVLGRDECLARIAAVPVES